MALKDFEGEKPTWKDTSRCVKQVEEGNPTSILPKAKAAWGAAVPERGGTPESCCWHRCPQDGTRGPSGSRCSSKPALCRLRVWEEGVLVGVVSCHVLGTWDSSPRCLMSGRGQRCPFSIGCGLAAWSGDSGFRMFEGFPGFQMPCVPPQVTGRS